MSLTIIFKPEKGGFRASIPEIPGVYAWGETLEIARDKMSWAIGTWLMNLKLVKLEIYWTEENDCLVQHLDINGA